MIIIYYILAAFLIYLSYKSFRGGIEYLRYFKTELAKPLPADTPYATIFVPCRGVDQEMLENLDALLSQDYENYEVVFILDDEKDEAAAVIESAWREARRQVKLIVAGKATDSSQKVENLREGVKYADDASEVFVFADTDARPSKQWLRSLVAPLADENVGASTGYRWFMAKHPTFASEMLSMWNASVASALGPNRRANFCWGGATAIRRETFERLNILERWRGTLSDDFTVMRAIHDARLEVHFVPRALTASIEDCTLSELFEFTTRQMKITRVYAQSLWIASFVGSGLFTVVMLSTLLILLLSPRNDLAVLVALFTLLTVTVFSIGKSWLRLNAVHLVLPEYGWRLRRQFLPQITFWALAPAIFLLNCIAALVSRRFNWRGTQYEMVSPTETRIIR